MFFKNSFKFLIKNENRVICYYVIFIPIYITLGMKYNYKYDCTVYGYLHHISKQISYIDHFPYWKLIWIKYWKKKNHESHSQSLSQIYQSYVNNWNHNRRNNQIFGYGGSEIFENQWSTRTIFGIGSLRVKSQERRRPTNNIRRKQVVVSDGTKINDKTINIMSTKWIGGWKAMKE